MAIEIEKLHRLAELARTAAYDEGYDEPRRACPTCLKPISVVAIPSVDRLRFYILCSRVCEPDPKTRVGHVLELGLDDVGNLVSIKAQLQHAVFAEMAIREGRKS